jgi:hypothetical protein
MNYYSNQSGGYDPGLQNAMNRQAAAAESAAAAAREQAAAAREQAAAAYEQAAAVREHTELIRQIQRAKDLGITHEEFKRRMGDHRDAVATLARVTQENADLLKAVSVQLRRARWQAWRKKCGLHWRNRCNWIRHPWKTGASIGHYAQRIEYDVISNHPGLRQANQQLKTQAPQVASAQRQVVLAESLL